MKRSRFAGLLVVRLLLSLASIGAYAPVLLALAQQPDSAGVYTPGGDVKLPRVKKQISPTYTADALSRGIEGAVWVDVVVMPDGRVGKATVTKSLDSLYGLDKEALKAAKKWEFWPGHRFGEAVPVRVTLELTFKMKRK